MSTPVLTAHPDDDAEDAWRRMRAERIHHMVVMDGKRIVGVLSERDLGGARGAAARRGRVVGELMSGDVVTADGRTTVRQAANLLRGRGIGCLPVVENGRLVGLVTVSDLLELLGRGAERPVPISTRWTLARRGPRRRPLVVDHAR